MSWLALAESHRALWNQVPEAEAAVLIRQRIQRLIERGRCDPLGAAWLTYKRNPATRRREIYMAGPHKCLPLKGLDELRAGRLMVQAMVSERTGGICKYQVHLYGDAANSGRPWLIAVHLDDKEMGDGACGHAIAHCHVGPTWGDKPTVRVPFPAVPVWDALDWALTMVLPDWEPVPWPNPES